MPAAGSRRAWLATALLFALWAGVSAGARSIAPVLREVVRAGEHTLGLDVSPEPVVQPKAGA